MAIGICAERAERGVVGAYSSSCFPVGNSVAEMKAIFVFVAVLAFALAEPTIYFKEQFEDGMRGAALPS